jgi:hypothetical protein
MKTPSPKDSDIPVQEPKSQNPSPSRGLKEFATPKEHLLSPGEGTMIVCSCGESFGTTTLADQHQQWHLSLASRPAPTPLLEQELETKTRQLQECEISMEEFMDWLLAWRSQAVENMALHFKQMMQCRICGDRKPSDPCVCSVHQICSPEGIDAFIAQLHPPEKDNQDEQL